MISSEVDCITPTRAGESTRLALLHNTLRAMLTTYHRPPGNVGMLLIKVFLKLRELVQVPLFLPQPITRIAELPPAAAAATVATEARRTTAIASMQIVVYKVKMSPDVPVEAAIALVSNRLSTHSPCHSVNLQHCHILSSQQRNNGKQPAFCIRIHAATWRQAD